MKTTRTLVKRTALIAGLVLSSGAWLSAQTPQAGIERPAGGLDRQQDKYAAALGTTNQSSQPLKINKGSSLIGTTVKNQQGETLGKITDLVIDFNSERVSYVVLDSASGVLTAQKLHAVPLRAFQPDAEGKSLVLNAEKAKLDRSAGFSKDNWPAVATPAWGAEPFWKDAKGTHDFPEPRALDQRYIQDPPNEDSQDTTKGLKNTEPPPQP